MKCFMVMAFAAFGLAEPVSTGGGVSSFSVTSVSSASSGSSSASSASSSEDTTTITSYYSSCSTLPVGNYSITATTTGTVTETLPCHECEMTNGIYTTYTTTYEEICPTGLAPKAYTIVEPCSEIDQPRPSTYIPQGFVVTTVACAPCAKATVTLTTPAITVTLVPTPVITPVPANTSTVCHTCNQTVTSIQIGQAATSTSLGLSILTLFSFIASAFWLL